jgi:glycosyltransferase involved in cell wall biosynthesis
MVSVCMATHNGATFLKEQLDSILVQLDQTDEVIISDDHSSDNTLAIIASYQDSRIRVITHKKPVGVSQNFEASLTQCKGDYIFLADQDDVWVPSKKEISLRYLQTYDLVMSDCVVVDTTLSPQHSSFYLLNGSRKGFLKNLVKNSYMGCCMAFNRKLLSRALPFPKDIPMHDQWIGIIGELHFKVHFMNEVLVYHRKHYSNATTSGNRSGLTLRKQLEHRYHMVKNIFFHRSYAR